MCGYCGHVPRCWISVRRGQCVPEWCVLLAQWQLRDYFAGCLQESARYVPRCEHDVRGRKLPAAQWCVLLHDWFVLEPDERAVHGCGWIVARRADDVRREHVRGCVR